ncbi:hypothetical protein OWV82_004489 [Melia azedarach]|uniref:Uncharacterized protein n=1 Tax=Melia azedarach TaxID=155640 RepID=A0ACC1YQC7_MELAZ|nr:hypothetical protein OWV82_004489 [Melia azedarach]
MASKDIEGGSVSEIVHEERGCAKSMGKASKERTVSKDMVTSFEARLAKLELSLGDIHERLDALDDQVGDRETDAVAAVIEGRLQQTFDTFAESMRQAMDEFKEMVTTKASPKGETSKAKAVTKLQPGKTLKYVVANINGVSFKALIDSGANQCLVAETLAKRLGLLRSKEPGWVKVVDQPPRPICGVARGVPMKIGTWQGKVDVNIVPMGDFQFVLGDEFIDRMLPFTFTDDGCMEFKDAGMMHKVPVERIQVGVRVLSALQVARGVKKGEETFLTILLERIKEGLAHDAFAKSLMELAQAGKTRRFWAENGFLCTVGDRIFIPKWGNLRRDLLKECHDSKWAGHPGIHRTLALVEDAYYWPRMRDDVEAYVRTCLVCAVSGPDPNPSWSPRRILPPARALPPRARELHPRALSVAP